MLGTAVALALIATPITAAIAGRRRGVAVRHFDLKEGLLVGAVAREHRRRGDLRAAARLDAAAEAGAHARGRVGLQRPGRRPARARADRVHQRRPTTASPTWLLLLVRQLGIGLAVGVAVGWLGVQAFRRAKLATAGPLPGRVAGDRGARVRRRRHAARLGLPRRLPGRARARARPRSPPSRRSPRSTRASRGSPRSAMFLTLGLLVFPHQLDDIVARGHGARARRRGGRAAARGLPGDAVRAASASASGSCSAGPACAARCRSCWRRSR